MATQQWLGLVDEAGHHLDTTVWGYGLRGNDITYPGPTFIAHQGVPIEVTWDNTLPLGGHLLPVDLTIHMDPEERQALEEGYVPTVVHLHGGHNLPDSDGLPEAWFTQDFAETGGNSPPSLRLPERPAGSDAVVPRSRTGPDAHPYRLGPRRHGAPAGRDRGGAGAGGVLPDATAALPLS